MALSAWVQHPVLGEYFKGDDFLHLYQIANHGPLAFLVTPHGGHPLVASNLAFALCHAAFGLHSAGYQWVLLLTHLLNVALLYGLIAHLNGSRALALFGSALWGMSPAAYGSIHWFSVYGNVLAAAGALWVLFDATRPSLRASAVPRRRRALWYAVLLGVGTTFGTGLAVAMLFGPLLYALRPQDPDRRGLLRGFATLALVLPLAYAAQQLAFPAPSGVPGVLGQLSRVGTIASMLVHLLGYGLATLLGGPLLAGSDGTLAFGPWRGEPSEVAVRLSAPLLSVAGVALCAWLPRATPRERWQVFGFALVAASSYAVVAVGRAFLVSEVLSFAWFVSTPRYHYLGPLAMSAALCVPLRAAARSRRGRARPLAALLATALIAASPLYAAAVAALDSSASDEARALHLAFVRQVEQAARPGTGPLYFENARIEGLRDMLVSDQDFPGSAALFVLSFPSNEVDGRRVFFVEADPAVVSAARTRPGSRIAELIVPLDDRFRPSPAPGTGPGGPGAL